jgi:predicted MFS family arabinose efflux permease
MKELPEVKKKANVYLRFSSIGIQMGGIIAFFTWLGTYLDKKQVTETPIWTIVLSLFGVAGSLYLVIREVRKIDN